MQETTDRQLWPCLRQNAIDFSSPQKECSEELGKAVTSFNSSKPLTLREYIYAIPGAALKAWLWFKVIPFCANNNMWRWMSFKRNYAKKQKLDRTSLRYSKADGGFICFYKKKKLYPCGFELGQKSLECNRKSLIREIIFKNS